MSRVLLRLSKREPTRTGVEGDGDGIQDHRGGIDDTVGAWWCEELEMSELSPAGRESQNCEQMALSFLPIMRTLQVPSAVASFVFVSIFLYLAFGMLCQHPFAVSRLLALASRAHPLPLNVSSLHRTRSVSSPPDLSIRQNQISEGVAFVLGHIPCRGSISLSQCSRVEGGTPLSTSLAASDVFPSRTYHSSHVPFVRREKTSAESMLILSFAIVLVNCDWLADSSAR